MKQRILAQLHNKTVAELDLAKADLDNLLDSSVGVAEHISLAQTAEEGVVKITQLSDQLTMLRKLLAEIQKDTEETNRDDD